MASLGNPRTWIPYTNNEDCSQGFCSFYCPQWCYIDNTPPPPFEYSVDDSSTPNFSPLVIAIIGILVSAFVLVSYYAIMSKYCSRQRGESASRENNHDPNDELDLHNHNDPSIHEPWHVSVSPGLDEALIKSITSFKYRRGNGLVGITDCSVCLSEFQDEESIRLLPKCSHAFHVPCIDTWLKSNSTCPLCRSAIFSTFNESASALYQVVNIELPSTREQTLSELGNQHDASENVGVGRDDALRAFSDLGNNLEGRYSITEIRDEQVYEESIRRSLSMDHDVLPMNEEQDSQVEGCSNIEAGPSKRSRGESSYKRRKVLRCVLSPIAMKRSFSSGRFSFSLSRNGGRGRQGIISV